MNQPPPPRTLVEAYLAELEKGRFFAPKETHESFAYMTHYFRRHATSQAFKFRFGSTLLILLSTALPFVAAFGERLVGTHSKDLTLSIMSAVIAALTAVLAHYRWEVGWRGQTEALFALQNLRADWEAQVALARVAEDQERAVALLAEAFERFRSSTFEVVHAEMGEFFRVMKAPDAPAGFLGSPG